MEEVFEVIAEAPNYLISNQGRVYSTKTEKILKPRYDKDGYIKYALYVDGKYIYRFAHRLVALTFLPEPPEGMNIINHKNEVKTDNFVENLEWCDIAYNDNYGCRNQKISNALKGKTYARR